MIAITGATGQLGQLVIAELIRAVPAAQIVAAVRDPAKAADLAALGIQVRRADYNDPATLEAAFAGVEKLLLISSREVGKREVQHRAVIDAAGHAGVTLLAYTSVLHADISPLRLATEHKATEAYLAASGLPHVVLRNGWYLENYTGGIGTALASHVVLGCAGNGRIAAAARKDYALAAVAALTRENQAGRVYELAGDESFTLAEFAAEIARQSGQSVEYRNLRAADYEAALMGFGLPAMFAALLADSETGAANGALFDDAKQLSTLIGHPTQRLSEAIKQAIATPPAPRHH